VRFHTTFGDIDAELYDAAKPITVQNFLHYVQGGYYTNMFMHRVVQNFVVQGGGFLAVNRGTMNAYHTNVITAPPITNEIFSGPFYSNVYGTIAMAKTSDPNSATSQFFFNLADNSTTLDDTNNSGGFTVFGHVIAGTNVMNVFKIGADNKWVKQSNQGDVFSQLPVLYSANDANVTFADLIYVDVIASPTTPGQYEPSQPYVPTKTSYNGLFAVADPTAPPVAGSLTLNTTATTKFTGSMLLGSARYSFTGAFDSVGSATVTAGAGKPNPLYLTLHVDAATETLTGTVSNASWVADLKAYAAVFNARTNPATAYAGKYTLVLPGSDMPGQPAGDGFASVTVDLNGKAKVTGSLADGSVLNQSISISRDGHWPLYASLYVGNGSISGWMTYSNGSNQTLVVEHAPSGSLRWRKSPLSTSKLYPGGFDMQVSAIGSQYTAPSAVTPQVMTAMLMAFSGGNLTNSFTNTASLTGSYKVQNTSSNSMVATFTLPTGLFKGTVKAPGTTRSIPFKGAFLQNQGSGYGFFLGTDQSGRVSFTPAAP
jgi:peptidyl-prolyl cis-trans isomerase A (cyclophilin A)